MLPHFHPCGLWQAVTLWNLFKLSLVVHCWKGSLWETDYQEYRLRMHEFRYVKVKNFLHGLRSWLWLNRDTGKRLLSPWSPGDVTYFCLLRFQGGNDNLRQRGLRRLCPPIPNPCLWPQSAKHADSIESSDGGQEDKAESDQSWHPVFRSWAEYSSELY